MKISNILIALSIVFAVACSKKAENDHGHEHGTEAQEHAHDEIDNSHGHPHEEGEEAHSHEQEEFTLKGDSVDVKQDSTHHTHEDGSTHSRH